MEGYLRDETLLVREAADQARLDAVEAARVQQLASTLVHSVRSARPAQGGMDAFLLEYSLNSKEGVILLCLAESLLRIPDAATADRLIAEKILAGDWESHAGDSGSLFVNASTWSLMLSGQIVDDGHAPADVGSFLRKLIARIGEPVVRAAMTQAMRILGTQFVMGRTIVEALDRAGEPEASCYLHSFDMLGEAALTWENADRHLQNYLRAVDAVAQAEADLPEADRSSISVKLSALHPRFEPAKGRRMHEELFARLHQLAAHAAARRVALTIDAEEATRLEPSMRVVAGIMQARDLAGWNGFGVAVQAYQRRAGAVIDALVLLAQSSGRRIAIRLVKGAYWDSEIKRAQEQGLSGYPVFTRKAATDVSWLACARRLLSTEAALVLPQFATHNAHSLAYALSLAEQSGRPCEFQRLHGMGRELYDPLVRGRQPRIRCRVYAPVGSHAELLPYLVRRLLENGANTSFVNRLVDARLPVEEVVRDPVAQVDALDAIPHPGIPDPADLFGSARRNSSGMNLPDPSVVAEFFAAVRPYMSRQFRAGPMVEGIAISAESRPLHNPARGSDCVGAVAESGVTHARAALEAAGRAFPQWNGTPAQQRAECLRRAADAFEAARVELMSLCIREAGKTVPDALAEVREAVDFLRFYATEAERQFSGVLRLPGPTGERNELKLRGRGVFVCISPWNFPLAIFTGQVAAALAAGNSVIAKPAEQTPLIASRAVHLLHQAGVPAGALSFLPGDGAQLGGWLLPDPRVEGVAFTGSTEVARLISRQLAAREGPLATLIAETGGQNVMIVDSSALPEQVVLDAATSAFNSAGQRCSALRVLLLQEEIADSVIGLLRGYMDTLQVGDPAQMETDIGPVIDEDARAKLEAHVARLAPQARWLHRAALGDARGHFMAPVAMELASLSPLTHEVFGPVLHVIRYRARDLDSTVDAINALGYGLTLGVQTRLDSTAIRVAARARVGNVYVNRNMIGAVVGVQPFGGCGLSGTGPKAGGPHYLLRFAAEQTISTNTAAVGGNAGLLSLEAGPRS